MHYHRFILPLPYLQLFAWEFQAQGRSIFLFKCRDPVWHIGLFFYFEYSFPFGGFLEIYISQPADLLTRAIFEGDGINVRHLR